MTDLTYAAFLPSGREWAVTLPYPPSLNMMWRRAGQCTYLSEKGRQFRANAVSVIRDVSAMRDAKIESRVEVRITLHAPTKRSYDVDNFAKAVLDALTHAGFWVDDSQVDRLTLERGDVRKGGCAVVRIKEVEP